MSNNSARASRFLYTFLCRLCTTTTWHVQIFSWFEYRNGKAINFTLSPSLWTQKQSPQFSFNLTSFLSSNWVTWYKGEKKFKGREVYFSVTFSLASSLTDRKVPNVRYWSLLWEKYRNFQEQPGHSPKGGAAIMSMTSGGFNPYAPESPVTARADSRPFYRLWRHRFQWSGTTLSANFCRVKRSFKPYQNLEILLSARAQNSQANILHLDQKAAKCATCKWLYVACENSRNVPSGEERGETVVFAG